jgi:hypothetical protein
MPTRPVRGPAPLEAARLSPYLTDPVEGSDTQAKPAGTGATGVAERALARPARAGGNGLSDGHEDSLPGALRTFSGSQAVCVAPKCLTEAPATGK